MWLLHGTDAAGRVLLQQRPARGIWARLYCLPAFASLHALEQVLPPASEMIRHAAIAHALTHRQLLLHVCTVVLPADWPGLPQGHWFAPDQWQALGVPAPVRAFLQRQAVISGPAS